MVASVLVEHPNLFCVGQLSGGEQHQNQARKKRERRDPFSDDKKGEACV
jgi:hypothetical protein